MVRFLVKRSTVSLIQKCRVSRPALKSSGPLGHKNHCSRKLVTYLTEDLVCHIWPCYYVLEFKFKNNTVHMYLSQSNCLVSAWILSWFMFKICLECSQLSEHCINLHLSFTRHDMQYCSRLSSLVKSDISL